MEEQIGMDKNQEYLVKLYKMVREIKQIVDIDSLKLNPKEKEKLIILNNNAKEYQNLDSKFKKQKGLSSEDQKRITELMNEFSDLERVLINPLFEISDLQSSIAYLTVEHISNLSK